VNLYRVLPSPPEVYDLASEDGQRDFLELSAAMGSESVRAIMVTNSAGDTVDDSGTSESLSRGADRKVLGETPTISPSWISIRLRASSTALDSSSP